MRKKGFTLIELMIVISIIGILSMMLVPRLNFMKKESKKEQLSANVLSVKSFLNKEKVVVSGKTPSALSDQIKASFNETYTASRKFINPFKDNDAVYFRTSDIPSVDLLNHVGKVVVIVRNDRIEGFGIDEQGSKVDSFAIKLTNINEYTLADVPPTVVPPPVKSEFDILRDDVISYLKSRVADDIEDTGLIFSVRNLMRNLREDINNRYNNRTVQIVNSLPLFSQVPTSGSDIYVYIDDSLFRFQFNKDYNNHRNSIHIVPRIKSSWIILESLTQYDVYIVNDKGRLSGPTEVKPN